MHDIRLRKTTLSAINARRNSSSLRSLNIFCIRAEGDINKSLLGWLIKIWNTDIFNFINVCVFWLHLFIMHTIISTIKKKKKKPKKSRDWAESTRMQICTHQRNHTGFQPWGEVNTSALIHTVTCTHVNIQLGNTKGVCLIINMREAKRREVEEFKSQWEHLSWQISYESYCNTMSKACSQYCQSALELWSLCGMPTRCKFKNTFF